jgi:hypothetical protein
VKVRLVGNEILDPDIKFISLVKRGANRSPFRILKAENLPPELQGRADLPVQPEVGGVTSTTGGAIAAQVEQTEITMTERQVVKEDMQPQDVPAPEPDAAMSAGVAGKVKDGMTVEEARAAKPQGIQKGTRKVRVGDAVIAKDYEYEWCGDDEVFLRWIEVAKTEEPPRDTSEADAVVQSLPSKVEALTSKVEALTSKVEALTSSIAEFNKALTSQAERLAAAEQVAKAADERARGTVVTSHTASLDESLGVLARDRKRVVEKSSAGADFWDGILSEFDLMDRAG